METNAHDIIDYRQAEFYPQISILFNGKTAF